MVDNPLRSYLQPGYPASLAGKIELTDERDPGLVAEFLRAGVGCLI